MHFRLLSRRLFESVIAINHMHNAWLIFRRRELTSAKTLQACNEAVAPIHANGTSETDAKPVSKSEAARKYCTILDDMARNWGTIE